MLAAATVAYPDFWLQPTVTSLRAGVTFHLVQSCPLLLPGLGVPVLRLPRCPSFPVAVSYVLWVHVVYLASPPFQSLHATSLVFQFPAPSLLGRNNRLRAGLCR